MDKIYALVFNETKEIVESSSFVNYWKNYGCGGSSLYGWSYPKKLYMSIGAARNGYHHIPKELKPHVSIGEFTFSKIAMSGQEIEEMKKSKHSRL